MTGENWLLVFGVVVVGIAAIFFVPQDVAIPVAPVVNAGPDGFGFVQARHDDRDFHLLRQLLRHSCKIVETG